MNIVKAPSIPFINNRSNFLISKVPRLHPSGIAYVNYWKLHKKRCIEGFWSIDDENVNLNVDELIDDTQSSNKWRYMPGNLYFYVNFGIILHQDEKGPKSAPKMKMRPYLRDIEWGFFYNWLEARGFSGFDGDDEFTCDKRALFTDDIPEHLKDLKYIPTAEYIRMLRNKPMGKPLYDNEARNMYMLGARGFGKDIEENSLLHYEDGSKKPIKNVKVGDKIFGADGKLTTVLNRFDYNDQEQFEVKISDGRSITSGLGHLWGVYKKTKKGLKYEVKELNDIKEDYLIGKRKDSRYFIPQCKPINYNEQNYYIHPYILGSLLGDGGMTTSNITFTTKDIESVTEINNLLKDDYKLFKHDSNKYSYTLRKKEYNAKWKNKYNEELKLLNLNGHHANNKFIPNIYKIGSIQQRIDLLSGLLDTDGHINKFGNIEFVTISKQLADDFIEVSRSLGITTTHTCVDNYKYRVYLKTDLPLFRLKRKLKNINNNPSKYTETNRTKLAIKSIKSVGIKPSVCISVDNKDKLFIANDFMVTHNSFMVGVGVILYELLFDGAKEYTKNTIENPYKVEIFVGAAVSSKSADILGKTREAMQYLPGEYIDSNGKYYPSPLTKSMSGTLSPNNMKNPWRHEYEKNIGGTWVKLGTGSNVKHGIYTTENPEAAAGTRPGVMVIEEVGLMSNVLTVHGSNVACQMEGNWKFGSAVYLGTGGNMEKIIESEIIFRDPKAFQFLEFDDVWEGSGKIGWFVPAVYGINSFKDKNGNTRFSEAYEYKLEERAKAKKAKSTSALDLEMMNYPLVPSEMFLNKTGNRFPIADLKEQLRNIENNPREYSDKHWYGDLTFNSKGNVIFTPVDKKHVVHSYPILDNSIHPGCIEFFEMPKRNNEDEIFSNRYYMGTDTYDDDDSTTNSLGSCLVMDGWTKRIVAEYTGRRSAKEFYEITRKMGLFYNAINNYENNKKGLFWHYEKKKSLNLLCDTPESLKDEANTTIRKSGNTRKGTPATTGVNRYAIQLIEMWLDDDEIHEDEGITPVQLLRSPGIIRELIGFSPAGNFDRVSALGMLLILIEDRYRAIQSSEQISKNPNKSELSQDKFFNKNYDYKKFRTYNKKHFNM